MGPVAIISCIACIAVFALNLWAKPRTDAVTLSLALLGSWAAYTVLSVSGTWPDSIWPFAIIDLAVGLAAWLCNRTQPELWKRLLYRSIGAQLLLHVWFWSAVMWANKSLMNSVNDAYALGLTMLGFWQIACGAWPGVSDVAGRVRARRRLSGDISRGPEVGAS